MGFKRGSEDRSPYTTVSVSLLPEESVEVGNLLGVKIIGKKRLF